MSVTTDDKLNSIFVNPENKYLSVLAASKRARQLLDKAEKHNLTVDTEKVILQALTEFRGRKSSIQPYRDTHQEEKRKGLRILGGPQRLRVGCRRPPDDAAHPKTQRPAGSDR